MSSRDAIREAATRLFTERGYAATSVRDIAAAAGVDPALVIRHFASKERLFLETMQLDLAHELVMSGPVETLGERYIGYLLQSDNEVRGVFLALLRASDASGVASQLREAHEDGYVRPLRELLEGPDAELRARLAAALVGGLLYALWVAGDEQLAAADHQTIATRYGALLQQLITP